MKKIVAGAAIALLAATPAMAGKLKLPPGMGGVPDIGAIPCEVFTNMLVIGPLGTKLSLLTWADGYFYATSGKTMDELISAAGQSGDRWDFERLTDHFEQYCEQHPTAITREAVKSLGSNLNIE